MNHSHSPLQLVIFGYGNPSRGDDALGPQLLHLLETHYTQSNITFIEDFQLQVEHILDLEKHDLALFIDASVSCPAPFSFTRLVPQRDETYTSHALHPAAVLYVYQQVKGIEPPPAFLLTLRGESFELGEPLSHSAERHLTATFELAEQLCNTIEIAAWEDCLSQFG